MRMDLYAISYGDHHYRFNEPFVIEENTSEDGSSTLIVKHYKFLTVVGENHREALNKLAEKIHYALASGALDVPYELSIC